MGLTNRIYKTKSERWELLARCARNRMYSSRRHWKNGTVGNFTAGDLKRIEAHHWWHRALKFEQLGEECRTAERLAAWEARKAEAERDVDARAASAEKSLTIIPEDVKQSSGSASSTAPSTTAESKVAMVIVDEAKQARLDLQQTLPQFYMYNGTGDGSNAYIIKWIEEFDDGPCVLMWYFNPDNDDCCSNIRRAMQSVESFRCLIDEAVFVPLVSVRTPSNGFAPGITEYLGYPVNSTFDDAKHWSPDLKQVCSRTPLGEKVEQQADDTDWSRIGEGI
jgi:hypothetical protein